VGWMVKHHQAGSLEARGLIGSILDTRERVTGEKRPRAEFVAKPTREGDRSISQRNRLREEGEEGNENNFHLFFSDHAKNPAPCFCSVGSEMHSVSGCLPWGHEAVREGGRRGRGT
jgi:hypothetical protein